MRDERGFTLLETLVSLTIAGIALAVLFGVFQRNAAQLGVTENRAEAVREARMLWDRLGADIPLPPGGETVEGRTPDGLVWRLVAQERDGAGDSTELALVDLRLQVLDRDGRPLVDERAVRLIGEPAE